MRRSWLIAKGSTDETLDWIGRRLDYELTIDSDDNSQEIRLEPEIISIEINPTGRNQAADAVPEDDDGPIDLDVRNWNIYDYATAVGVVLLILGLAFALLPSMRSWGVLFPIGAALMAFAGYGARRRDAYPA